MYMGNSIYKEETQHSSDELINKINKIATEYIIEQNYSDMKHILDKNKYDEILDLVTTILSKNIKTDDIEMLVSRLYSSELDSRNTHLNKCRKIAVFYLKVAHLFDSIMMTINPHTTLDKLTSTKSGINMCTRRLNALINANVNIGKHNELQITSPACHIDSKTHALSEEDGIPELETLYYDEYDFESGEFNKMSEKMKREYKKDVELFYNVFSTNSEAKAAADGISKVERFSDIKISDIIARDYDTICNSSDKYVYINRRKKAYRKEKERLFKKYADNVKLMTVFIHKREHELLDILNQVFTNVGVLNEKKYDKYNISQNMHSYTLDKLTDDVRRIIVGFYSKCEEFYVDGVQIYDAIVQNQLKYTTIKQVENSNVLLEKMILDDDSREIEKNDIEKNDIEKNDIEKNDIEKNDIVNRRDDDYSINEGDKEEERPDV